MSDRPPAAADKRWRRVGGGLGESQRSGWQAAEIVAIPFHHGGRRPFGSSGVAQVENFEEADAGLAVAFLDDGGVGAGRKHGDYRGFEIV
jgi:hypothetical protein